MKLLIKYFLLALVGYTNLQAQVNLLANGSFEIQSSCPDSYYQLERAIYWTSANPVNLQNGFSLYSILFDSCATNSSVKVPDNLAGGGIPQHGHAYVGFYPIHFFFDTLNFKMYIQTEIQNSLKHNVYYCFKMYVKRGGFSRWSINDFSVYFSQDKLQDTLAKVLDYINPQITNTSGTYYTTTQEWKEYSGYFKADGGEKYLTIGSFLPIDSTPKISMGGTFDAAFYFIDNVQLYECGDSLNTAIIENNIDSKFKIYPNPTTGTLTIEVKGELTKMRFELYDALGNIVYTQPITGNITMLTLPAIPNGIYNVRLYNSDKVIKHDKLVIIK